MTLFDNIHLGTEVEVARHGRICLGKVRWKGHLVTKQGDWIGVELNQPVGCHSGMFKGRRYFQCTVGYGVFVRPWQIRFRNKNQRSYDSYHTLSKESYYDETLFSRKTDSKVKSPFGSNLYAKSAAEAFQEKQMWSDVKNFHLKHAVSATIPPASCRPSTANHENIRKSKTQMYLNRLYNGTNGTKSSMSLKRLSSSVSLRDTHDQTRRHSFFITPPSIPVIHDPTSHTKLAW